MHIFDELPDVSLYQEVLLSTLSTTHKLVVYLIVPGTCTLNVYVTSPGEDDGINEITSKLLAVLRTYLHHDYSIVDRLQLQLTFHDDSFFFALLLISQLHKHGRYLLLSEETIFQYKLSFVVNFIHLHDQYLGRLNIERLSSRPYPFYTTQFDVTTESDEDTNKFKLLEQKGWHVMDVKGDGNCGYYALLLALLNTGIDEYEINTTNDYARRRAQRWERQVVQLRDHLRQGSESLLREVYRPGSPSRSLPWWGTIIGTPFEEDQERLSEGFVNPKFEGNPSLYI